jgi:hypothetical protein
MSEDLREKLNRSRAMRSVVVHVERDLNNNTPHHPVEENLGPSTSRSPK